MRLPWILTSKLPKIKYQSNYWQKFEFCPSVSRDPRTKRIRFFRHVSAVSRDVSTHYATPFSFVSLLNFCRKRWCGVFLFFLENSQNSWLQLQSRINRKHLWALKIQKKKKTTKKGFLQKSLGPPLVFILANKRKGSKNTFKLCRRLRPLGVSIWGCFSFKMGR